MSTISRSGFVRYVVVPLTLLAFLSACHKWSTICTSPAQYLDEDQPDKVRVTWHGSRYEIQYPAVRSDSLVGLAENGTHFAVPIGEVERVEARSPDSAANVGLVMGILVGVAAVVAVGTAISLKGWTGLTGS